MSKGICACFAVVAMLVCGSFASAGQPSVSKMSQMGLSGAKVVSDGVAMQVRGEGAIAFSKGKASGHGIGVNTSSKTVAGSASVWGADVAVSATKAKASVYIGSAKSSSKGAAAAW